MKVESNTEKLKAKYDRVTKEHVESKIKAAEYFILPGTTVTICNLRLENGFSVRGESACVDSKNFDQKIGEEIAYLEAFNKVWELEGYLLAQWRYNHSNEKI